MTGLLDPTNSDVSPEGLMPQDNANCPCLAPSTKRAASSPES
jgi:hypothetical protein